METIELDYPTHSLTLYEMPNGFIKAKNIVKGTVYEEMRDAAINICIYTKTNSFVQFERILLNNFIKSLVGFNNTTENIHFRGAPMYFFSDESEYQLFCILNDVAYERNAWFNTIYMKTSFITSIGYFKDASTLLVKTLYPTYYQPPKNLFEEWIKKIHRNVLLYKCDMSNIEKFLKDNDIQCLYHFTNRKNIGSIKQHGICSIDRLNQLGIQVHYSSTLKSREIDKYKKMSNYVHLGYEKKHPMLFVALAEGRLCEYALLMVSPVMLLLKSTIFTDINAASSNARFSADINFFLNLPFSTFHNKPYLQLTPEEKKFYQAEVLVEQQIEIDNILNISDI